MNEQLSIFDLRDNFTPEKKSVEEIEVYPIGSIITISEEAIEKAFAEDDICTIYYLSELKGKEGRIISTQVDNAGFRNYEVFYKRKLHNALLIHDEIRLIMKGEG